MPAYLLFFAKNTVSGIFLFFSLFPLTNKVGSNSFFSLSGSGFNGFPSWHLYCLAVRLRHTEAFFILKYLSLSFTPLFFFI